MEMAFVPVNLYILFFWHSFFLLDQRSAGDPSFLLCRGSCILPSTYVESTFQGRQERKVPHSFSFLIDSSLFLLSIYVVEAPLHQVVINSVYRSQPSFLPARFHTRLAFCTVALPSPLL